MKRENGKRKARFWVLKLLKDNFATGDILVNTVLYSPEAVAQGFKTNNDRKILLTNKKDEELSVQLPADTYDARISYVDVITKENPPEQEPILNQIIKLKPFSVAVIKLKN